MATEQDALRRDIVGKREEIADDIVRLERELRYTVGSATDWQGYLRRRPAIVVGLGLGLGLAIGLTIGGMLDR